MGQQPLPRGLKLGPAHIGLVVQDLSMKIRLINGVELDKADRADPRACQVQCGDPSQTTYANDEHLRGFQSGLAYRIWHGAIPSGPNLARIICRSYRSVSSLDIIFWGVWLYYYE